MTESEKTIDLVITRVFAAPRELVYQAFVDPDQLAQWFGPVGFSVPRETVDIDLRVGGHQRFTMVSNDDPNFTSPVNATFTEVVANELVVATETWSGGTMNMRLELADVDGGTQLTIRQGPYTEEIEGMARTGWTSSFTKLDALLGA